MKPLQEVLDQRLDLLLDLGRVFPGSAGRPALVCRIHCKPFSSRPRRPRMRWKR